MWMSLIHDVDGLKRIYKDVEPSLENVVLSRIQITPGEDINVRIEIHLSQLPEELPLKWKNRGVDRIVLDLNLSSAEIYNLSMSNDNSKNGDLIIEGTNLENKKHIRFIDKNGKEILALDAQWVSFFGFGAYQFDKDLGMP